MLKAAQIFSNNMVLQRDKNIAVWGKGEDGRTVSVTLNGITKTAAVRGGKWSLELPPMSAGGEYEMVITDATETITFYHVVIGEVWLCGGQSNMELELQNAKDGKEILSTLDESCGVRFYYTPKVATEKEAEEQGNNTCWNTASPENSKAWSAVGFHFARKLSKELGVTVGLIGCNWGGTSASSWVDRETLERDKTISSYIEEYDEKIKGKSLDQQIQEYRDYEEYHKEWCRKEQECYKQEPGMNWDKVCDICGENKWPGPINELNPFRPANMFHNMLMRLCPYTLKGFLYYQGESDDHKLDSYYKLLTSLISLWREKWGDDSLPFIMVQLPMFQYSRDPDYKHWCKIRSAQMKTFRTVKNTGIAVISDCGELDNIHPLDKQPVGERLCLQAQKLFYGMDVKAFGPLYKSYIIKDGGIELSFDYAENGFVIKGEKPMGFEIAGEDGNFVTADIKIDGSKIFVSSPEIAEPKYVRYNWFNYAEVTIYNETGIPLAPFSTFDE